MACGLYNGHDHDVLTIPRRGNGLLPASQDRGHDPRAAPPVHHRDDPQGLFFRRVGNQIFTHRNEAQGPSGEVRAFVALTGNGTTARIRPGISSRTRRAGMGLSSAMYSRIPVMSCAASG